MIISGSCAPQFSAVRDVFSQNFSERGEVGASVCVMVDGDPVVNLWGGVADVRSNSPWCEDTLVVVMSCTKGAVALCGHLLADRGLLDLNAPVTRYWPEFGRNGKSGIRVRQLFSHQSGIVHVKGAIPADGLISWDTMIDLLEKTSPFLKPGTRTGYHVLTHGYLIGEIVRRISGRTIGQYFKEAVAQPLGLDFWIGLPQSEHRRVAKLIPAPLPSDLSPVLRMAMKLPPVLLREMTRLFAPADVSARTMTNLGGFLENFDTPRYYEAEIPSAGGITNARGLAGMYAPLASEGRSSGSTFIRPESIAAMRYAVAATDEDAFLGGKSCFTLGFSKSWSNEPGKPNSVILGEDAFGTPGFGGSIGFADPHHRFSFGYAMNRQGEGTGLNARGQSLIDAVYRAMGATTNAPGFWARRH